MIGVTVATSKRGLLWPTEHWKCLIDSLCRGGAKHDPRLRYPVLARYLSPLVQEHNGRFFPTAESGLAKSDDTAITFLRVVRVKEGEDSLSLHSPEMPDISDWALFEFPYFGTIGDSIHEAQTKSNRVALAARDRELVRHPATHDLWLHFRLSSERRDRDLDNLGDALMPFFNGLFPELDEIRVSKSSPIPGASERLWASTTCAA